MPAAWRLSRVAPPRRRRGNGTRPSARAPSTLSTMTRSRSVDRNSKRETGFDLHPVARQKRKASSLRGDRLRSWNGNREHFSICPACASSHNAVRNVALPGPAGRRSRWDRVSRYCRSSDACFFACRTRACPGSPDRDFCKRQSQSFALRAQAQKAINTINQHKTRNHGRDRTQKWNSHHITHTPTLLGNFKLYLQY